MEPTPKKTFEIRLGGRVIARREAITPQVAVLDYLRAIGCDDDDVVRVASDAASWRGAVYTAVEASSRDD